MKYPMQIDQLLLSYKSFSKLEHESLLFIGSRFHKKEYERGEVLIKEGELVTGINIIYSGNITAFLNHQIYKTEYYYDLTKLDIFGELELLTRSYSAFTIVCSQSAVCYFLPADDFFYITDIFPDIKEFFYQIVLKKFSIIIRQLISKNGLLAANNVISYKSYYPSYVQRAVDYIDKNYANPITLNGLAQESGVSKYYLSRLFKQHIGKTFKQYLNYKRIIEAKRIMQNHGFGVTETCYAVGFNDLSHFSKLFKQIENITPSQFKRQLADKSQ